MADFYDDTTWRDVIRLRTFPEFASVKSLAKERKTLFNETPEG